MSSLKASEKKEYKKVMAGFTRLINGVVKKYNTAPDPNLLVKLAQTTARRDIYRVFITGTNAGKDSYEKRAMAEGDANKFFRSVTGDNLIHWKLCLLSYQKTYSNLMRINR